MLDKSPKMPAWWIDLPWWARVFALSSISFMLVWISFSLLYLGFAPVFSLITWFLISGQVILVTWLGRRLYKP